MKLAYIFLAASAFMVSCGDDTPDTEVLNVPATYSFERNGLTSISFEGQTDRIQMAGELSSGMSDFTLSADQLIEMFRNRGENSEDVSPFESEVLNSSTKSIKDKIATSFDYFNTNSTESSEIKADFETWINNQVAEVYPNEMVAAEAGIAGQINDGGTARFVNANGLEYNQMLAKALIGAMMADQMLNNYLSVQVLDNADNVETNDEQVLSEGKNYTAMEHKWDEAYGYLFGNSVDPSSPLADLGSADNFMNKYLSRVNDDADFAGIADRIYDAFKKGRAALLASQYDVRDEQADIIQKAISEVIAIRAVYYLQAGKRAMESGTRSDAFHDLSEGLGFVYSLRFTRNPQTGSSYFTKAEVDAFVNDLSIEGNGFWDVPVTTLESISEAIADRFDFTLSQAAE